MTAYIRERVILEARHAIALADQQSDVQHPGLRGRLREIVALRLLRPWLPPYVGCGTGTIINGENDKHQQRQDDLIIFDRTLMPPILIEETISEGIFVNNGVLLRIEVKSKINAAEVKSFAAATRDFTEIGPVLRPGLKISDDTTCARPPQISQRSALLAFDSDVRVPENEIRRYSSALSDQKAASILCVLGVGLWMLRKSRDDGSIRWHRLRSDQEQKEQQLACFTAIVSTTVSGAHCERSGINPNSTLSEGIGLFFPKEDEWEIEKAVSQAMA
jgi:hypothetical protein